LFAPRESECFTTQSPRPAMRACAAAGHARQLVPLRARPRARVLERRPPAPARPPS
jgi:hypothetical protein